jgi:hypothetical protein
MIVGGILVTIALITYIFYRPKLPNKGSLSYYRYNWRKL